MLNVKINNNTITLVIKLTQLESIKTQINQRYNQNRVIIYCFKGTVASSLRFHVYSPLLDLNSPPPS